MVSHTGSNNKYIVHYSEPEIKFGKWLAQLTLNEDPFDRFLIVPLCSEKETFPYMIQSVVEAAARHSLKVLLVLVVNHRKDAPVWMQENNKAFLKEWRARLEAVKVHPSKGAFFGRYKSLDLLVVDRATAGLEFPKKQGVGLARKIGCDIAYFLWELNKSSAPFAFTSDGDAVLPEDYFVGFDWEKIQEENISAVTFPFQHFSLASMSQNEVRAMQAYDHYLRYYQKGLDKSGSPYAYQTIGSTICFSLYFYGKVRGFPKKQAGEDFYFLNKLRKLGPIKEKKGKAIKLQGRPSQRVPFGTGKSIICISQTFANEEEYLIYNPHVFEVLKILLDQVKNFCVHQDYDKFLAECEMILLKRKLYFCDNEFFKIDDFVKVITNIGLKEFLLNKINQAVNQNIHQFMVWFDSFKTLKFIHELRYHFFSSISYKFALMNFSD